MKRRGVEADPKRFQDVRAVKLLNEVVAHVSEPSEASPQAEPYRPCAVAGTVEKFPVQPAQKPDVSKFP
jgi:hypothetical protein